ncbi:hypothetical protein Y1Q_0003846 [Alligator mississippiensis]|uniref:Uncharacterized protein n=1 Tax=Alligator mississippiensis TaxID=8496 RepID=A0A151MNF8_ALLMI|nr:hypothetical protein Y1Q_0003846 [Alligator mississippiensis]
MVQEGLLKEEQGSGVWPGNGQYARGPGETRVEWKRPPVRGESIIPMYTENIQEAYRMPNECRLIRWLHEAFLWPVIPPYGGLPVKLHTHVGEPIPYDPDITAEELAKKTQTALQNLIQRHQQIPGSMWKALLARLDKPKKR